MLLHWNSSILNYEYLSSTLRLCLVMRSGPIQSRSVDSSTGTFWICTIIINRTQKTPNNRRLWCRFDYGKFLWSSSSSSCYLFAMSTSAGFDIASCYHYSLIRRSQCTLKYWAPVTPKSKTSSAGFFFFLFCITFIKRSLERRCPTFH